MHWYLFYYQLRSSQALNLLECLTTFASAANNTQIIFCCCLQDIYLEHELSSKKRIALLIVWESFDKTKSLIFTITLQYLTRPDFASFPPGLHQLDLVFYCFQSNIGGGEGLRMRLLETAVRQTVKSSVYALRNTWAIKRFTLSVWEWSVHCIEWSGQCSMKNILQTRENNPNGSRKRVWHSN